MPRWTSAAEDKLYNVMERCGIDGYISNYDSFINDISHIDDETWNSITRLEKNRSMRFIRNAVKYFKSEKNVEGKNLLERCKNIIKAVYNGLLINAQNSARLQVDEARHAKYDVIVRRERSMAQAAEVMLAESESNCDVLVTGMQNEINRLKDLLAAKQDENNRLKDLSSVMQHEINRLNDLSYTPGWE